MDLKMKSLFQMNEIVNTRFTSWCLWKLHSWSM